MAGQLTDGPPPLGPAQCFALQGDRRCRSLRPCGQTLNDLVGPRAQGRLKRVPVPLPKNGMERGGPGGPWVQPRACAICGPELRPHAATALARRAPPDLAQHARTKMEANGWRFRAACARQGPERTLQEADVDVVSLGSTVGEGGGARGGCRASRAPRRTPPLSLLGTCHATSIRK